MKVTIMAKPWCKHYRGMHEKESCEAGIQFKQLPIYGQKDFFDLCPCFGPQPNSCCDKAIYRTAEKLAAIDAERNIRFQNIGKARNAIVVSLGGPWKKGTLGSSGCIDCPVCLVEKSLRFTRIGYNGHIHARCNTKDCVSWIE